MKNLTFRHYNKLSYKAKWRRTLFLGVPLLIVVAVAAILWGESVFQKVIMPIVIGAAFLTQLIYTYTRMKNER